MQKHEILKAIKLTSTEKAVLHAIEIQKIARNASKISKSARIPRTSAIYSLEKLLRWKLVRKVRSGKHWLWM